MRKTLILFIFLCSTLAFAKGDRRDDPSYQVEHDKTKGYTSTEHYTVQEIAQLMGLSAGYIPYITSDYLFGNSTLYVSSSNLFTTSNDLTINSDLGDVTSKLIFGRTTGGNGEISWNGTVIDFNKDISITGSYPSLSFMTDSGTDFRFTNRYTDNRLSLDNVGTSTEMISFHSSSAISINTTALIGSEKLRVNGDIYGDGNISGLSFTDRTPFYEGDALAEIMKIKGKDGEIDHSTLPEFAKKDIIKKVYADVELDKKEDGAKEVNGKFYKQEQISTEIEEGRDLGAMISILTVAIQQLKSEIDDLKKGK